MKSDITFNKILLLLIKQPKIFINLILCLFTYFMFYIRSIIIPCLIGDLGENFSLSIKKKFIFFIILYIFLYLIGIFAKNNLNLYSQEFLSNYLFINLVENRQKNIADIPSSIYNDIYNVINETSILIDKFFSVTPLIITIIAIGFFIFKNLGGTTCLIYSIYLLILFSITITFGKILSTISFNTNIKKNDMIDINEDINKNLITIISFQSIKHEIRNIKDAVSIYINSLKKYILSVDILKIIMNGMIIFYYLYYINSLFNNVPKIIYIQFLIIYLGLIQYISVKGQVINEFFYTYGKLKNSINNITSNNYQKKRIRSKIDNTKNINSNISLLIENLNYTINGNKIFKNFNCHISKNKITIIKGSIGAGKSTLLKLIMGLLEPESGRIFKGKFEICNQNTIDWMNDIAFIGQHPILFNRSVKENITYPNNDLSSLQKKVLENIEYKNIFANIIDKKQIGIGGQKLSGGQKQLISIFRTLKENKNIILLDEPTSDLDPNTRDLIYKLLKIIKSFNKTIIIVTHDLDLINLGDEIIDLSPIPKRDPDHK